jgi:hypothetical protein
MQGLEFKPQYVKKKGREGWRKRAQELWFVLIRVLVNRGLH